MSLGQLIGNPAHGTGVIVTGSKIPSFRVGRPLRMQSLRQQQVAMLARIAPMPGSPAPWQQAPIAFFFFFNSFFFVSANATKCFCV